MNKWIELITNYHVICGLSGWFVAQILKVVVCLVKEKRIDFQLMISSGGMPSSHSSLVCAILAAMWMDPGPGTPMFALALTVAMITMYDAANVRRHSGEHARLLNIIINDLFEGKELRKKELKELIGHTPVQVIAGAVLGVAISIVIACIMM